MQTPYDLLILGAGAAGLMAAIAAAESLQALTPDPSPLTPRPRIAILEKNPQPGIKILVCGGGRCNLTNAGSLDFLIAQFGRNGRFLSPALGHLSNAALRNWFAREGVPTHEEHHGKIYPDSNQARSIVDALVRRTRELRIETFCGPGAAASSVTLLPPNASPAPQPPMANGKSKMANGTPPIPNFLVTTNDARRFTARSLLLAVGGNSYQRMGTTGDGYRFAGSLGHTLITPRPAIVALLCQEEWPKTLQGLAVQDVEVTIEPPAAPAPNGKWKMANRKSSGDLLFTHFGLSGPAILNPSEIVAELLDQQMENSQSQIENGKSKIENPPPPTVTLRIDFLPHLTHDHLAVELRRWQQHHGKKLLRKTLAQSTPEVTITSTSPDLSDAPIASERATEPRASRAGLEPRASASGPPSLAASPKSSSNSPISLPTSPAPSSPPPTSITSSTASSPPRFTITATRGFKEAMVTAGGVALSEVDPKTMQSKIVPGLYLAGEVLDLTGPSGGYNLQLAFSTGHLAGTSAAATLASIGDLPIPPPPML